LLGRAANAAVAKTRELENKMATPTNLEEAIVQLAVMDARVARLQIRDEYCTINTARRQQASAEQELLAIVRHKIAASPMVYLRYTEKEK
jgi:hypothetical protein